MKSFLIGMLRLYRTHFSGLKRVPTCKFIPTCSQYAMDAIEKHGALKGSMMAVWRVLRCNPFSKGGIDLP